LLHLFESTRLNVHAYYFSSFHTHNKNNKSSKPEHFPFILIDREIQAMSVIYVHWCSFGLLLRLKITLYTEYHGVTPSLMLHNLDNIWTLKIFRDRPTEPNFTWVISYPLGLTLDRTRIISWHIIFINDYSDVTVSPPIFIGSVICQKILRLSLRIWGLG